MSILPAFKAVLDETLDTVAGEKLTAEVRAMNGVLSASFNERARNNEIWVTYASGKAVELEVKKLDGVVSVQRMI